nr:unnamed protein product [Callosobruchus chinensis]
MKKFITTKINKQQWRVTVPNINGNFLRKSPARDEDKSDKGSKRSSGFYDFQEAQSEYDKSRSLPASVYVDSSGSDTEEEEIFIDATSNDRAEPEGELYQDIEDTLKSRSEALTKNNSQFEYDVPKISFKFFEKHKEAQEQNDSAYEQVKFPKRTEVKITLSTPEVIPEDPEVVVCHPSEKFVSQTEIFVKNLESIPVTVIKSAGSDPNLTLREHDEEEYDESFYKVPRSLKKTHRLSQSLNDFDVESLENQRPLVPPRDLSIEHVSASQVLVKQYSDDTESKDSETLDYCKVRSKLPIHLKRASLLRKPKKAVDKWNDFRSKFSNLMVEHAAQQKVGAFGDKDKLSINFEEIYKNSKNKCKKALQTTGKIFHKKRSTDEESQSRPERVGLKASDIEYKLNISMESEATSSTNNSKQSRMDTTDGNDNANDSARNGSVLYSDSSGNQCSNELYFCAGEVKEEEKKEELDFTSIKSAIKKRLFINEGQNGFEDLRRYVKQGGDFCKELATILQERSEAETQYAKSLSKLSAKLSRACRDGVGGVNDAWKSVAHELETRAEAHKIMGNALLEEIAKPLKTLTENQHRIRKQSESSVDKAAKLLSDWRAAEAKGKKHSHVCARENEKLQDAAVLDNTKFGKQTISKSTSLIHLAHLHSKQNSADKDNAKLEGKKKKAEDAVKKADIEYYTLCVRAERARLEWESAVVRGAVTFQSLEEERLNNLKSVLTSYLHHNNELIPRLIEATERLKSPISQADSTKDLSTFQNLRHTSQQVAEQLLPDFYCEHITLAMNRERRKQALMKLLHLIRQDIERERKSKNGLENLCKAIKQTPSFGTDDSQQSVSEKLYHMKSMLTYLEGARYKVQSALAELDSRPRTGHPLASHITITRDKSGLQQSVLKVPQWLRDEWCETNKSPLSEKSLRSDKSDKSDNSDPHINDVEDHEWLDRGAADGNSNQPDSDFDEFSSQSSAGGGNRCYQEEIPIKPIATCKAIYPYTPNMPDELALKPGDSLKVYRQQDDGWWLGECNGNVGIFPATYVELVTEC